METAQNLQRVMNNFDWEKVHRVMGLLSWKWYGQSGQNGVPSITAMQVLCTSLAEQAVKDLHGKTSSWVYSGGFKVTAKKYVGEQFEFEIEFILEHSF